MKTRADLKVSPYHDFYSVDGLEHRDIDNTIHLGSVKECKICAKVVNIDKIYKPAPDEEIAEDKLKPRG